MQEWRKSQLSSSETLGVDRVWALLCRNLEVCSYSRGLGAKLLNSISTLAWKWDLAQ